MTHCLWSTSLVMLTLLALLSMVSSRSVRQLPNGYPPLLPAGYYGQSPYAYTPYGYGYQAPHFAINPPGTYYDNVYGIYKTYPGGGYPVRFDYPHPDQQQYYYVCKPNCVIFSKCRNLESFNSSSGRCVQHVPQHRPDHMQPQCQKEGRFPHPHDCKVYYRCDKNRTHPWLFACPEDTIFSPVERKCLPGDQCPSTEISESGSYIPQNCEIKFPECAEEGTFRSPTDCALYYTCRLQESGTYLQTRFKCPGSNSFDLERKLCRPRNEVDCVDYVSGHVPVPYHAPQAYYPPYPAAPLYEEDDYDTEAREQQPAIQSGKDPLFERPSVKIVVLPTTPATTTSKRTAVYPSYEHTLHHSGKEPSLGSRKVQANDDSLRKINNESETNCSDNYYSTTNNEHNDPKINNEDKYSDKHHATANFYSNYKHFHNNSEDNNSDNNDSKTNNDHTEKHFKINNESENNCSDNYYSTTNNELSENLNSNYNHSKTKNYYYKTEQHDPKISNDSKNKYRDKHYATVNIYNNNDPEINESENNHSDSYYSTTKNKLPENVYSNYDHSRAKNYKCKTEHNDPEINNDSKDKYSNKNYETDKIYKINNDSKDKYSNKHYATDNFYINYNHSKTNNYYP
ncbi:hypothetical protein M5D96_013449 [Drosophila gunungcola]|uniref:Chitin-binding type-2 domain-containing protein n=1 Tax=Drosophila gunungcola TaxID=103775 RepID=A0A9P9YBB6_9MUSC|nr:hypothetical protein M5D96_013449 [Drosophila gunungcola]